MNDNPMMPAVDLERLELKICDAIDNIEEPEQMVMLGEWLTSLGATLKFAKRMKDEKFIRMLGKGSLTFGPMRYYVGDKKKVVPVGNWQIMEALLEHTAGDAKQIAGCLASDAWKPGGIKKLIGETKHKELFTTEVVLEVKTGKPIKELKQINSNFTN